MSGAPVGDEPEYWEPIIVRREAIEAEYQRLAELPLPDGGRRQSLLVHPRATEPGLGLAPGIRVTLTVLRPGERTRPMRQNATQVGFCIAGGGRAVIGETAVDFDRYDVWNVPSYRTYWYQNDTDELQVRLDYSNAPVLEKLHVLLSDDDPSPIGAGGGPVRASEEADDGRRTNPFGTFQLNETGASMMPYETLINPPAVASRSHHWPWVDVKAHLDKLDALGDDYVGRRLYLLHNPATGRTNGTTPSFFATMTIRPPGIVDRPHRHVSAAINYFFHGHGWSRVAGRRYEWGPGDLMLTAPGWAIHHHASGPDERVYELTVQDQPYHLALESLLWQEDLKKPARVLGAEAGFATNRPSEG
jgi:gentisate 1,2-dioxygenase